MYDPFAPPPAPGTVETMAAPDPTAVPSGVMPMSPNNALGNFHGMGRAGRMLNGMQLPADMTAMDFMSKLQGLDWKSLHQGYRGDVQDWRQGGMSGARPQMQDQFAQYFGGTYGDPSAQQTPPGLATPLPVDPVMTPGGGPTGAPPQGPNTQFPLNPGATGSGNASGGMSNDWRTMRAPRPQRYGF